MKHALIRKNALIPANMDADFIEKNDLFEKNIFLNDDDDTNSNNNKKFDNDDIDDNESIDFDNNDDKLFNSNYDDDKYDDNNNNNNNNDFNNNNNNNNDDAKVNEEISTSEIYSLVKVFNYFLFILKLYFNCF
jgi:hypothetical protein